MRLGCVVLAWLAVVAAVGIAQDAAQDAVVLKDGRRLAGAIQWETPLHVGLRLESGLIEIAREDIQEIQPGARAGRVPQGMMDLSRSTHARVREPDASRPPRRPQNGSAAAGAGPEDEPFVAGAASAADADHGTVGKIGHFLAGAVQRLGPFLPRESGSKAAVGLLLFLVLLGLVQIGCRLVDVERFDLARGLVFNIVLCVAAAGSYSLRGLLREPLAAVLMVLVAFVMLAAAASVLFQERAGKSTILVGWVLFAGSICLTSITVGVSGVLNLYR
ncbi:MAG: hypothetical protein JXQ29_08060 [Planctomycetes bacterium]|nr:hypothetical protein [Planctomycetota bacterium]